MTEEIKFREQAEDELYNQNKKQFLVTLPPKATLVAAFFILLIATIAAGLFFLRVPIKIIAPGSVDAGSEIFVVSNYWDDARVKEILVSAGETVKYNQALVTISREHDQQLQTSINSLNNQINIIQNQLLNIDIEIQRSKIKFDESINKQMSVIWSIGAQLKMAETREEELLGQFKKGLTAKDQYIYAQEKTSSIKTSLAAEKASLTQMESAYEVSLYSLVTGKNQLQRTLSELEIQLSSKPLTKIISSPCDCIVTNLVAKLNSPITSNKELLWLQVNTESETEVVAKISSSKYKPIEVGTSVFISTPAFPSLRFGKIKGKVKGIAFKKMVDDKSEAEFVVRISVDNIPENIILTTGMSIEAEFILDSPRLYEFIVK